MNTLPELQEWYRLNCNGEWEHHEGVSIGTLDNPGWSLEVSLCGTPLASVPFEIQSYGIGANAEPTGEEWIICRVEGTKFKAFGGPRKLEEMIQVFLQWAAKNCGEKKGSEKKRGQEKNIGAPAKRASARVKVPPVQLDGSAPQTVPTALP